jgi:putative phosphoesterase
MRIALFADVHANLPALKSVISDARTRKIDESWNLGDMVGYSPFPNESVKLLAQHCSRHVLGNHDIKCADSTCAARMRVAGKDADKVFSFEWTNQTLNAASLKFIASMPRTVQASVEGINVLITHGSPKDTSDCLTARTPVSKLKKIAADILPGGVDVVVCGHSHQFFDRTVDGIRFINPGGIGRSFDGDQRASYCVLDITQGEVHVEFVRVPYSMDALTNEMQARAFPARLIRSFEEARSLEDLDGLKFSDIEKCATAAMALGKYYKQHEVHARQVARLSGEIFDGLQSVHGLGWRERAYLNMAAFVHDIGWVYGGEGHHKASRDLVLKDRTLPIDGRERILLALIARYHRGSLPEQSHKFYKELSSYAQETVGILSACLRIADGLDRSHQELVDGVRVSVGSKRITFIVSARQDADISAELSAAKFKSDLLRDILGIAFVFKSR